MPNRPASDPGVVTEAAAAPEGGAPLEGAAVARGYRGVGPGDRADLSQPTRAEESAGEVAELLCWECPPDAIRGLSAARVALWQRQCGKCDSPGDQSALEGAGDVLDSRNGGMLFILALPVIIGPVGDNAGEPHRGNGQTGSL